DSPSPAFFDLYFMKVGGIGLPYLPETDSSWLVTSSKPVLSSGAKVSIYPNPASSYVGIVSERNINKVEILDMSGTMVYSSLQDTRKEASVQVSHLRSGIYTVCVYEVDGSVSRQLISIVR
ncbi:Por secretion system C-terminal sorting domain-containing protein, partial [Flexibacter flexilis DSM 6793]